MTQAEATTPAEPRSRSKGTSRPRWSALFWACVIALALPVCVQFGNWVGPERLLPAAANLYLPQLPWALPAAALIPLCAARARRLIWIPSLALLWVLGPIMGFCFPWPSVLGAPPQSQHLRLLTWNVKTHAMDLRRIVHEIGGLRPDVVVLQDSSNYMDADLMRALPGLEVRRLGLYFLASRYPIEDVKSRWFVRAKLRVGSQQVTLYDAHLVTPRFELLSLRHPGRTAMRNLAGTSLARLRQASDLALDARAQQGPMIVAGDLNAPPASLVCREMKAAGLWDSFESAGFGYGFTYGKTTPVRRPYLRIDHVFVSHEITTQKCFVGPDGGPDHLPVIADLVLGNK